MKRVQEILQKLGFSDIEIIVYLHIVDSLEISAYEIAKDLAMSRATVYKVLERLKKHNLVLEVRKNNVKQYHTESYKIFKSELEEKAHLVDELIPLLRNRSEDAGLQEPLTKMYTGVRGLKVVWDDIIEQYKSLKPSHIYVSTHPSLFNTFPGVLQRIQERRDIGIVGRIMYPASERENIKNIEKGGFDQIRFYDDRFGYNGEVTVYGEKVALFTFNQKKPLAIVIESKEMSEMMKNMLLGMWASAKE